MDTTLYYYKTNNSTFVSDVHIDNSVNCTEITKAEYDKLVAIRELKNELVTYDYIGVKIAMGVATIADYATEIAHTEELRARIRELEGE